MALSSAARKDLFFFSRQGEPTCTIVLRIRLFLVLVFFYVFLFFSSTFPVLCYELRLFKGTFLVYMLQKCLGYST